jgi:hypothetical protein
VITFFLIGVTNAGKEKMMIPLLVGFVVAIRIYGFKSPKIWVSAICGGMIYLTLLYPYAQYARTTDLRNVNLIDAIDIAIDLSYRTFTDSSFRDEIDDNSNSYQFITYAPDAMKGFSRLMFIGEADYLISQTFYKQEFTGFKTITHGFEMIVPHFLYPDKPQHGAGAFLGYYAGQLGDADYSTQVSYGFFANLYNAFGLIWVMPSTFFLVLFIFGLVLFYWGRPETITPSVIIVVMMMQHSFLEGTVSSQIQVVRQPINFAIIFIAMWLLIAITNGKIKLK